MWYQLISLLCALLSLVVACIKWGCDPKWQLNKCQPEIIQQDNYIHTCVHKHPLCWQNPMTMATSGPRSIKMTLCSNSFLPILPQVSVTTCGTDSERTKRKQSVNVGESQARRTKGFLQSWRFRKCVSQLQNTKPHMRGHTAEEKAREGDKEEKENCWHLSTLSLPLYQHMFTSWPGPWPSFWLWVKQSLSTSFKKVTSSKAGVGSPFYA